MPALRSQTSQKALRRLQLRKQLFLGPEFGGVDAPPAAIQLHWVPQMKHLVIDDVLDGVAGYSGMVEDTADDDRVVGRIVVAEQIASAALAPTHLRAGLHTSEEAQVEVFKNCVQVVNAASRRDDSLAPAHLAHEMRLVPDFIAMHVTAIASGMTALDGLTVHFRQQDMGKCAKNWVGRAFQQIGEAHVQFSFAQTDGVVHISEREEFNREWWQGRAGAEFVIAFLENREDAVSHLEGRVARFRD